MDKKTRNILIILLLLFLWWYYSNTKRTLKKVIPEHPPKKYRCDAGGCLECAEEHSSCHSKSKCEELCINQIPTTPTTPATPTTPTTPTIPSIIGCMDATQINYDATANVPCPHCCIPAIMGCNDPAALNYYTAVSQGWGCTGNNPNNHSCCAYMGTNGIPYYGT